MNINKNVTMKKQIDIRERERQTVVFLKVVVEMRRFQSCDVGRYYL